MKYIRLLTFFFLVTIGQIHAQQSNAFGFKGGLNVSTIGNNLSGYGAQLGYNFGIYSMMRPYQEVGLQVELLVSKIGARNQAISDLHLNYTYLTLPVFSNIYFAEGTAFEVGLQFGYLLSAIEEDNGNEINIREDVKNFDFSGIIGVSYSKPFGSMGLRYVLGINNTNGASRSAEVKFKNKVLQLYIAKNLFDSR